MRRHRRRPTEEESEEDSDIDDETTMKCVSCKEEYGSCDAGTCRECYEEASETEEELKREIEELKAKVNFLRFWTSLDHPLLLQRLATPCFTDVVLVASGEENGKPAVNPVPVPAHKAVLVSSPFIKCIALFVHFVLADFVGCLAYQNNCRKKSYTDIYSIDLVLLSTI